MNWTAFFSGYAIGVITVFVWAWIGIIWDKVIEKKRKGEAIGMDEHDLTFTTGGYQITLCGDDAEILIAFIKNHEREDIPDNVWEICMKMYDALEEMTWNT